MRFIMIKGILPLLVFMMMFAGNIYLVKHIHAVTRRDTRITVLLQEFDSFEVDESLITEEEEGMRQMADKPKDRRVAILKAFFRKYESPLYDHAEFIVTISDQNSLDYRLIPAISMQESGACRVIPHNSHNCWGWGIYGNLVTRFSSYPEAITAVATGLKKYYIDKGLRTPEEIMRKYNPSSNGSWAFGVNTFIDVLE